nr:hypothetical protein [uncultured Treponema sp.]
MEKKKYLDAILCGLVVSFICSIGALYIDYTINKNVNIMVGFGFLALIPYIILIIFFGYKGILLGFLAFVETNILFLLFRLLFLAEVIPRFTFFQWVKITVLSQSMFYTLISGVIAGIVNILSSKRKISVFIGIFCFLILNIVSYIRN